MKLQNVNNVDPVDNNWSNERTGHVPEPRPWFREQFDLNQCTWAPCHCCGPALNHLGWSGCYHPGCKFGFVSALTRVLLEVGLAAQHSPAMTSVCGRLAAHSSGPEGIHRTACSNQTRQQTHVWGLCCTADARYAWYSMASWHMTVCQRMSWALLRNVLYVVRC